MLKLDNVKTITELRENPLQIFEESAEPTYIFSRSKPVGIVMSVDEYNKITETLEEYLDSLELKEAVESTGDKEFLTVDDAWKKYKLAK